MSKTRVHDVATINKIKFEPYGDYVNQVYSKFDETLINNQDPHGEIEDDEIPRAEYSNGNDLEETETNKTSTILNFMPTILTDDDITEGIISWNSKQKEVFNAVHKWSRKYNGDYVEPVHIFLSDSGGTGKSHLVKVIYKAISKTLLYYCKDPEKPGVHLPGPIGILAVNIVGTTIHSGFESKPGTRLPCLNNKSKAALRNRLLGVKCLSINALSLVSSAL